VERRFETLIGSDISRDGFLAELRDEAAEANPLLEAFWSDVDGSFTFRVFVPCEVPFHVIEEFIRRARDSCPPLLDK
jgi:hypothetical protein